MFAGNWSTFRIFKSLIPFLSLPSLGRFALGILLGIAAVSMWQQFHLAFGLDPVMLLMEGLVLSLAFWLGQRWSAKQTRDSGNRSLSYMVLCVVAWSLLHPFWIETITTLIAFLPISWLEGSSSRPVAFLVVAILGWLLPGMLWFSVMTHRSASRSTNDQIAPSISLGIASGLVFNAVMFAPRTGVFVPTILSSVLAIGVIVWRRCYPLGEAAERAEHRANSTSKHHFVDIGMSFLVGGLLACHIRLINQLMPHGAYVLFGEVAGIFAGIACGLAVVRCSWKSAAAWSGLCAAASSSLLFVLQPLLVDLSLWMNSTLTNLSWLMIARIGLLVLTMFPFGVVLAGIAKSNGNSVPLPSVFVAGISFATFLLGGSVDTMTLAAGCSGLLFTTAVYGQVRSSGWVFSIRTALAGGLLLAMALSLPAWRHNDDASRTAKVLFSTPAFVAYRSGWSINQLSALDDLRLIHRTENSTGSLTLWRGRVAELYVREAGVPRSVMTRNPEIVPQFAPEVLQAVYSLVLADRPGRIMLLGLSGGVPLSTCLEFPVREVVCTEGDSSLINLVRGPIARETGFDPLVDDRVTLQNLSPEMALMARPTEPFDVILSCPPSSALTSGAANFTTEFYQRASRHLSQRGLFCQRFECVDYGPEPLRIVLKSMRNAFQQVIAIETAAGEFLLMGANSDEVFIPGDLASRLELPHIPRILARSGLDWSTLLNQPAYDHEALGEICADSRVAANSAFNGLLGAMTPAEVMRWGNKQQETQEILTTTRLTKAPFWTQAVSGEPRQIDEEIHLSRRSRLVEWLGDSQVSLELLRRLKEVTTQQKLVHENPDAHWWEYRKTLKAQLQERPRTIVQQVKAIDEKPSLHPEDIRRRDYFVVLGNAVNRKKTPTREEIAAVEEYLEPYDPLLSYFARQEIADLLARCDKDADRELAYRLHVIFFAPTRDASVRNVATALNTLVKHPDVIPDPSTRFDALNGLVQTMRTRWETRQFISETSVKKVLEDVDQSLISVENGVTALDQLAVSAGIPETDWKNRKQVIERLLLRPLRSYRAEITARQARSQMQARAIFEKVNRSDQEE